MSEKNVTSAIAYYQAMNDKNLAALEKFLHPNIQFLGPLAAVTGKNAYLESLEQFFLPSFNKLTIRAKFGSGDQAMLVFDLDCPAPIGILRTAVLMTFRDDLITRIEAFFDPRLYCGELYNRRS